MKLRILLVVLIFISVIIPAERLVVGRLNLAFVLMFHPEMRDYLPQYERFASPDFEFEGEEIERVQQRIARIEETESEYQELEREFEKINKQINEKNEELTEVNAELNMERFEINARYRDKMKNADFGEVAKLENERDSKIQEVENEYEDKIVSLRDDIDALHEKASESDPMIRRQKQASQLMDQSELFLGFDASMVKAQSIIDSIQQAVDEVIKQHNFDLVINTSLYSPIGKIVGEDSLAEAFRGETDVPLEYGFSPTPGYLDDTVDAPEKPLHNLLDSNEEEDIFSFYEHRFNYIESIARIFYIPVIDEFAIYGPKLDMREDITREVILKLFEKYNVRDFEKEVTLEIIDLILSDKIELY
ncbi:MAG: hypothetical protein ACQESP_06850 [Candidatus Muiribacteriota bacterium]